MPVHNHRVVVIGTPGVNREFSIVQRDKREAQRLAEMLAKATEETRAEVLRQIRVFAGGR